MCFFPRLCAFCAPIPSPVVAFELWSDDSFLFTKDNSLPMIPKKNFNTYTYTYTLLHSFFHVNFTTFFVCFWKKDCKMVEGVSLNRAKLKGVKGYMRLRRVWKVHYPTMKAM